MAFNGKAWMHGSATHPPRVIRNQTGLLLGLDLTQTYTNAVSPTNRRGAGGVVGTGDLLVTGTGGLGYSVAVGEVAAVGTFATAQGVYTGYNDAAIVGNVDANSAFIRFDLLCWRVRDTDEDATGAEDDGLHIVKGISASTDPAIPASLGTLEVLARATVPATSGAATFADLRKWVTAIGGRHRCRSTLLPTNPYTEMAIVEVDTGIRRRWNGSAWRREPGEVAYVSLAADSLNYNATPTDITSLTTSVTAGTTDVYEVTVSLPSLKQEAADGQVELRIVSGGGTIFRRVFIDAITNQDLNLSATARLTGLVGANTIKAQLSTSAGNVDVLAGAQFPATLHVKAV